MPKRLLLSLIVIFPLVLGACDTLRVIEGSGDVVTETRAVSGFDRVILGGIGELTLIQGEEESLEIEAEDNILPQITTEVRDGTLTISFDDAAVREIAKVAEEVNNNTENIGARRLHTLMEYLLEDILFEAPDLEKKNTTVDLDFVVTKLSSVKDDEDLSRYIL